MKIKLTCLLFLISFSFFAQEEQKEYRLSLDEAIERALDSSYNAINARRDIEIALKKKWETTADGLPQIDANIDYQNSLKRPVQLLPAEIHRMTSRNLYSGSIWNQAKLKCYGNCYATYF